MEAMRAPLPTVIPEIAEGNYPGSKGGASIHGNSTLVAPALVAGARFPSCSGRAEE
jgi:hypothetical protein